MGSPTPGVPLEIKQGDIFWVEIPHGQAKGSEQAERRPYVIVSRTAINRMQRIVVGVPLTTKLHKAGQHRITLPVSELIKDLGTAWTPCDSVALTDQIRVLDITRLEQPRIGRLSGTAVIALQLGLAFLFDIR